MIDSGISIPDSVKRRKEEMMILYKSAQENMQLCAKNKGIMIGLELDNEQDEEMTQEKINNVLSLCQQQEGNEENITICIQGEVTLETEESFKKAFDKKIKIIMLKSYEEEIEYFKSNEMSTIYHVTDSPKVMNKAIVAVKAGILPIIFSTPNRNISYVDEIDKLYSKNLRIQEINNKNKSLDEE